MLWVGIKGQGFNNFFFNIFFSKFLAVQDLGHSVMRAHLELWKYSERELWKYSLLRESLGNTLRESLGNTHSDCVESVDLQVLDLCVILGGSEG